MGKRYMWNCLSEIESQCHHVGQEIVNIFRGVMLLSLEQVVDCAGWPQCWHMTINICGILEIQFNWCHTMVRVAIFTFCQLLQLMQKRKNQKNPISLFHILKNYDYLTVIMCVYLHIEFLIIFQKVSWHFWENWVQRIFIFLSTTAGKQLKF